MKKKLDEALYNDPWEFVDDMWLMFNNAWLYNRKTSKVYKFCTKVSVQSLRISSIFSAVSLFLYIYDML